MTPVLTCERLAAIPGVRHAFFTRQGGVSTGIYDSLNVGAGSKDDPDAVVENKRRVAAHFDRPADALVTCWQSHSTTAFTLDAAHPREQLVGDALATAMPGLICGALAADCAPILLADAQAGVIGSAHAGWRGALDGVVESAVAAMVGLGARPERIVATVGPCIGPASYEVGLEFLDRFAAEDPGAERFFQPGVSADKRRFDLPAYVLSRLARAGVADSAWIGRDTCAEEALFFSNRRAFKRVEADYGRLISAIMLV